jgi:hypothetical protein
MTYTRSYRSWLPLLAVGATALVLAARLYRLVDRYAVNIFFADQWEFNDSTVFQSHSLWQIFTWQQGPHREGLGGILAALVEPHFRWDSRIESFLVAGILVVGMLLALWLKKRLFGEFEYYDLVIPSVFLTATQCELIFGAANLALGAVPLLLIVGYCLGWTVRAPSARFVVVLTINLLLIFTGFGLLMGVVTPLAILASLRMAEPGRRQMALHFGAFALALASLGLFFANYRWNPDVACYDSVLVSRTPANYAHFAALIWANYLGFDGLSSRHPALWGFLLLGFFLTMLAVLAANISQSQKTDAASRALSIVPFVLMAFSLAFSAAAARGRLCLGWAAAEESRYMPYLTPGFLGAYLYLNRVLPRNWLRHAALTGFALLCMYASWPVHLGDQLEMTGFRSTKLQWKNCYLASRDINSCNHQVGRRISNPGEDPLLREKLDFLEKEHLNLFDGR